MVLSAGPASHPIGEFAIDLPRPRDVAEVRVTPRFIDLHKAIWNVLRERTEGVSLRLPETGELPGERWSSLERRLSGEPAPATA